VVAVAAVKEEEDGLSSSAFLLSQTIVRAHSRLSLTLTHLSLSLSLSREASFDS